MNYELALKLKEAGFPMRDTFGADLDMFTDELSIKINGNIYMRPTLGDLIEACGWRFADLNRIFNTEDWCACAGGNYSQNKDELRYDLLVGGNSAVEAVAKLWLRINAVDKEIENEKGDRK